VPHPSEPENIVNTKSMLSFMKGILPAYFDSEWSFAQFRLVDSHAICAIKDNRIIAISADGNYYLADIDKNGGECKKILQKNLLCDDS
jgi:WD repeat-containing protein 45